QIYLTPVSSPKGNLWAIGNQTHKKPILFSILVGGNFLLVITLQHLDNAFTDGKYYEMI
mgnify:CR=1